MTAGILEQTPIISSYTHFGQSEEAKKVQLQVRTPIDWLQEPIEHVEPYRVVQRELRDAFVECAEDNWDGYGAKAASFQSYYHAQRFVMALPDKWLNLEVGIDPDGEVSFDWFGAKNAMVTVCVGADGELAYSGRFGLARIHGVEIFNTTVPKEILGCLSRLT